MSERALDMAQSPYSSGTSEGQETIWPEAINELIGAASYVGKVFLLARDMEPRLRAEIDAYLHAISRQQADFYQFQFITCLQQYLDSDLAFTDIDQVREYAWTIEVKDQVPWFLGLMQSLWHLGHDSCPPATTGTYRCGVAVLVTVFNETRFAELCLKSIRGLAGFPHRIVVANNSTQDVSDFREAVLRDGLVDEWFDSGCTYHGDGLQRALSHAGDMRYIAALDSDAVGLRESWLRDLVHELDRSGAGLAGPGRIPMARDIIGFVVHPCCMLIDRERIGSRLQIDFRSQWPFWDVGGLLTWDCMAHGIPIIKVGSRSGEPCALGSTLVNGSVQHYWYVSRISTLKDDDELDGYRVGDIRARLEREYAAPELDAIKRLGVPKTHASTLGHDGTRSRPRLSVVLTTYNRQQLLETVLEGFARQTAARDEFEVVLVDDGSIPPVRETADKFTGAIHLKYLWQENNGLAAARNAGIRAAEGEIVLLGDDDDVPAPELVAEHLRSHREYPDEGVAVLGHRDWHPDLEVTPLMHYVTHVGGEYFGFDRMQDGQFYDQWKWWGGLVSTKRSLLQSFEGPFDTRLHFGYEDTELACRLADRHVRVLYNARARTYVLKPVTFEEFCRRSCKQGRALHRVAAVHPELIIPRYQLANAAAEYRDRYAPGLEEWTDRVTKFEALLTTEKAKPGAITDRHLQALYTGYRECFRGCVLKGYVEQLDAAERGAVSVNDPVNVEEPGRSRTDVSPAATRSAATSGLQTGPARPLKIAFVDTNTPCYDMGSSCLRIHQIVKILVAQGHHIDYLYTKHFKSDKRYKAVYDGAVNFIKIQPSVNSFCDYLHFNGVDDLDVVWVTNLWALDYTDFALQLTQWLKTNRPQTKVIIDTMDLHHKKHMRRFELSHDPQDRETAERFLDLEKRLYPLADRVLAVTEVERRDILHYAAASHVEVVPNIHEVLPQTPAVRQRRNLCFLGAFRIQHNFDAIQWFLKEVFPLLIAKAPDVQLHLLGHGNEDFRETFEAHPNVKVIGYVENAELAVARYRLFVCPMVYGAGMKGKLGVAAAAGTPFVTTTVGAEGFGFIDGRHCFITDEPGRFADRCLEVMRDDIVWHRFRDRTGELLAREFSVEAVAGRLTRLLRFCAQSGETAAMTAGEPAVAALRNG